MLSRVCSYILTYMLMACGRSIGSTRGLLAISPAGQSPAPDGRDAYAMLHRPTWDLGWIPGHGPDVFLPAGLDDARPGIWISYVAVDDVMGDVGALTRVR